MSENIDTANELSMTRLEIAAWPAHAAPLTRHEAAFVDGLEELIAERNLHWDAELAAVEALKHWAYGRTEIGTTIDADARLAFVRWSLLHRLSPVAAFPPPPLSTLLAMGDSTPDGWMVAVRWALHNVLHDADQPRPGELNPMAMHRGRMRAITALGTGDGAVAPNPGTVENLGAGVRLELPVHPGVRVVHVVWIDAEWEHERRTAIGLTEEQWHTIHALVEGLHAADRMALPEAVAAKARLLLTIPIVTLLRGWRTPSQALERLAKRAAHLGHDGGWRRLAGWKPKRLPRNPYALVAEALERLARAGAEPFPPAAPLQPGTWVMVQPRPWSPLDTRQKGWGAVPGLVEVPDAERDDFLVEQRGGPVTMGRTVPLLMRYGIELVGIKRLLMPRPIALLID